MYQNAPFSSYEEAVAKLRKKEIGLLVFKNKRAVVMEETFVRSHMVGYLFFLQFVLPLVFIIGYAVYTRQYLGLLAALPYLILPLVRPLPFGISMLLTGMGVLGLALGWHPVFICFALPAQLAWWGEQSWWNVMQYFLLKRLFAEKPLFDTLWERGVIGFHDKKRTYKYA